MRYILQLVVVCVFSTNLAFAQQLSHPHGQCAHVKSMPGKDRGFTKRSAAQENYDVKFYHLDIDANATSAFINANVSMKAVVTSAQLDEIEVGLSTRLQVDSAFVNDIKVDFTHDNDIITLTSPTTLVKNDVFTTIVHYQGNGQSESFFSGITSRPAFEGMPVTYTLSEPLSAIDWFACKQSLDDKADSAYVFITVPSELKAGSNGLLTNVRDMGNGKSRYEWKTRYPIAYYLISFAVADYMEYNTTATIDGQELLIQNYLYNNEGVFNTFKASIDLTGPMIEEMSEMFGIYPFIKEKYGHAMAPLGGGMEHQTMSTMDGFEFTLIAHELGHQWFGNSVTCATWQDIWINEGFARYCEYLMIDRFISKASADNWMDAVYADVVKRTDGSVYVPESLATDDMRIFDGTLTYNKGGVLLHMIRNFLNDDDVFFEVLGAFLQQYKDATATGDDFRSVLESVSGMGFEHFFDNWYYGEGHPVISGRWNHDSDTLYLEQAQKPSHPSVDVFHFPVEYEIGFEDNTTQIVRFDTDEETELFKFSTTKPVKKITLDPNGWLLKKRGSLVRDRSMKSEIITSSEFFVDSRFQVYPNPAVNNTVRLHAREGGEYDVQLLDSRGMTIQSAVHQYGDWTSSMVAPGVYLLRVVNGRNVVVRRVVVK